MFSRHFIIVNAFKTVSYFSAGETIIAGNRTGKLIIVVHVIAVTMLHATMQTSTYGQRQTRTENIEQWNHQMASVLSVRRFVWKTPKLGWLGSRVVTVLDSGTEGPGLKSQPRRCRIAVLRKLFTPIVPLFTKQRTW